MLLSLLLIVLYVSCPAAVASASSTVSVSRIGSHSHSSPSSRDGSVVDLDVDVAVYPGQSMDIIYPYPNTTVYVGESFTAVVHISPLELFCGDRWSLWASSNNNNIKLQLAVVSGPYNPPIPATQTVRTIVIPAFFQQQHITDVQIYAQCDNYVPPDQFQPISIYVHQARVTYAEFQFTQAYFYGTSVHLIWQSFGPTSTEWGIWVAPGSAQNPPDDDQWQKQCVTNDLSCMWTTPIEDQPAQMAFQIRDAAKGNDLEHVFSTAYITAQHASITLVRPQPAVLILTPNTTLTVQWSTNAPIDTYKLSQLQYNGIQMDPATPTPPNNGKYTWQVPQTLQLLSTVTISACIVVEQDHPACDSYDLTVLPPPSSSSSSSSQDISLF